jgi:type II secretory pathway component PulK
VIAVLWAIKSSADAEWECKRCEQLRILYQQKWIALGLDWRLLVELADWKESEENYDEAKVRWDDLRASNKHKVSKAKLNWDLRRDLLRRFNLDFYPKLKDYEENRIPDWDSLEAEIPRSDNS